MEPNESTEGSPSRSLDVQPCAEEPGTTSEPFLSSDGGVRSALAAATTAADAAASAAAAAASARAAALFAKTPAPYSDNLLGPIYAGTPQIGHESLGFEPVYVSSIAQDPYTTTDFSSSAAPAPGFSSDPITGSSSGPVLVPGFSGYDSLPGSSSVPDHGSVPTSGTGPGSGSISGFPPGPGPVTIPHSGTGPGPAPIPHSGTGRGHSSGLGFRPAPGPGPASGAGPGPIPGPELRPSTPQKFRNLRPDLFPTYTSWNQYCHWEPQKQPPWESLQVSEPGARGLWKTPEGQEKPKFLYETMPRGQCLLYNWEEERATNHLDQVPNWQDISESFFFRHGHQGLLTMQPHSPMPSSTTQKDSYQPPRNLSQPLRGVKHESQNELIRQIKKMKEFLGSVKPWWRCSCTTRSGLHSKEVQADLEPIRKPFEAESVTHHDYQKELVQAGLPAPTKPHDYRQEQPETFWIQRAPQLPGVSNIRTLDTPFRKNCSFSTPVPLSLGQPLPYEFENYPHQLGEMSSLACQGKGQRHPGGRMTPV